MKKKFSNDREGGFIKITLIIVAALVLLKYIYDVDVVGFLTQGKFREILDKLYEFATMGWERYKETIIKVWNYIVGFFKKS